MLKLACILSVLFVAGQAATTFEVELATLKANLRQLSDLAALRKTQLSIDLAAQQVASAGEPALANSNIYLGMLRNKALNLSPQRDAVVIDKVIKDDLTHQQAMLKAGTPVTITAARIPKGAWIVYNQFFAVPASPSIFS